MGHENGRAIQVVVPRQDRLQFCQSAFSSVLDDPAIRDLPVALISVAGAFRKGKSFLLNLIALYLEWMINGCEGEWLHKGTQLNKFSFRDGFEPDTQGIYIWSKPFILDNEFGSKIAVILMDTQGIFDFQSSIQQCANIFGFSSIMASHQIYNIAGGQLNESDLQNLALFTEVAKFASIGESKSVLQKLTFLVRDWSNSNYLPYGYSGGRQYLNHALEPTDKQVPGMRELRRNIRTCAEEIDCFLMPHPGLGISQNTYGSTLGDVEPDFQIQGKEFVASLFRTIRPKMTSGNVVTCKELVTIFKVYGEIFQKNEMPKIQTLLEATVESSCRIAFNRALNQYKESMMSNVNAEPPLCDFKILTDLHEALSNEAKEFLKKAPKYGDSSRVDEYATKLAKEINNEFKHFESIVLNNEQNRKNKEMLDAQSNKLMLLTMEQKETNAVLKQMENDMKIQQEEARTKEIELKHEIAQQERILEMQQKEARKKEAVLFNSLMELKADQENQKEEMRKKEAEMKDEIENLKSEKVANEKRVPREELEEQRNHVTVRPKNQDPINRLANGIGDVLGAITEMAAIGISKIFS